MWNFFLDLLETGSFTDSQVSDHDLCGFTIVFTTNFPHEKLNATFPAELLSRFSLKSCFSRLSAIDKNYLSKDISPHSLESTEGLRSRASRHCRTISLKER